MALATVLKRLAWIAMLLPRVAVGATCSAGSSDCVAVGEWDLTVSLGAGVRTNPVVDSKDIPLVVIPHLTYYGKRFFLDNLDLGFTLHEGAVHTFDLVGTPGYDRAFFVRHDLQNFFVDGTTGAFGPDQGIEVRERPRRTTYLVGPEWLFDTGRFHGQLTALYEVTGRHDGYEVRGALAMPLLQATTTVTLSAGFTWKSAALVNYYYGVDRVYDAGDALNPFARLGFSRPLHRRWSLSGFVHYERLDSAIARSPAVVDDSVLTVFAGVTYSVF